MKIRLRVVATATFAALACAAAAAHDTWFEPRPNGTLALGTGNRFPVAELAVDDQYFVKSGCTAADGSARTLDTLRFTDTATLLRPRPGNTAGALICFMQLKPFDIDLPADKIEVYFKEIRPSADVLAAWEGLKARGLPFREHYIKSARIDLGDGAAPVPTGTLMDALRLSPSGALTTASEATFQVLRDGQPLADFPVEFINERSPIGLWQRTDAQGLVRTKLPLPGRWLMRGTKLQLSASDPTRWESQFITYAFAVLR